MTKKPDDDALDAAIIETAKRISLSLKTLVADTERLHLELERKLEEKPKR
jgi:hypothetical protein